MLQPHALDPIQLGAKSQARLANLSHAHVYFKRLPD